MVLLSILPLLVVCGALQVGVTSKAARALEASYAEAGGIASQALSCIRTVASYTGEPRLLDARAGRSRRCGRCGLITLCLRPHIRSAFRRGRSVRCHCRATHRTRNGRGCPRRGPGREPRRAAASDHAPPRWLLTVMQLIYPKRVSSSRLRRRRAPSAVMERVPSLLNLQFARKVPTRRDVAREEGQTPLPKHSNSVSTRPRCHLPQQQTRRVPYLARVAPL